MMRLFLRRIVIALGIAVIGAPAFAAGTIPLSLTQQIDQNGKPLAGCLVYFYQAGTVASPQNSFQDFGLTITNPNPLKCDLTGRVPVFWLADGLIHVRLTDSTGIVQLDTTMQVIGPSSGGGGGGGASVDPTTIFATGDVKFRPTSETLTGWIKLNGQTIGSATSGGTQRANADTQNLFTYLWTNCASPTSNHHCAVVGGIGSSAIADFSANKQITLPDWRDRTPIGLDDMGNTPAGGLLSSNVTSGNGDGVTTPGASGGVANPIIAQANFPNMTLTTNIVDPGHTHNLSMGTGATSLSANQPASSSINNALGTSNTGEVQSAFTGITANTPLGGSGTPLGTVSPFQLGTWFQKL